MKTIRISMEVWEKIKELGEFGDTPDAVLRRLLGVPPKQRRQPRQGLLDLPEHATRTLSTGIVDGELVVRFQGGEEERWLLPDQGDHEAIRKVRDQAVKMAADGGASFGQIAAVKKTLTASGYYVRQPNPKGGFDHLVD